MAFLPSLAHFAVPLPPSLCSFPSPSSSHSYKTYLSAPIHIVGSCCIPMAPISPNPPTPPIAAIPACASLHHTASSSILASASLLLCVSSLSPAAIPSVLPLLAASASLCIAAIFTSASLIILI
ncbi:hypothetical protein B0H65DRAFT_63783 [Neurospora tetraspora]|uniref:Uncharacterized protein n=1 Tax=Neurospora tetraspora TaxID=94610 RepID=A0AAE0MWY1_9PEZI|nr:hypothetical protein B0H65DRAFT_63783 [Neurospora tetraspora]